MGDPTPRPSQTRRILGLVGVCAVAGVILWFALGDGGSRISAYLTRPPGPTPSRRPTASSIELPCRVSQLKLIGAFDGCADRVACTPAPSPAPDYYSAILFVRDAHRDYILYVAVDGGYHGPDRYQLRSWGDDVGLSANDRIAKVMLRDSATGAVWQSYAGSLTILPTGTRGMVDAAFEYIDGLPTPPARQLLVSGPWSCG